VRPRRSGSPRPIRGRQRRHGDVKEFEGTCAGLAIVEQSRRGDWEVMVIDSTGVSITGPGGTISGVPTDSRGR
jgi:hypothetical protein